MGVVFDNFVQDGCCFHTRQQVFLTTTLLFCVTCFMAATCFQACLHPEPPMLKHTNTYATSFVLAFALSFPLPLQCRKWTISAKGVDWQCGVQDGGCGGSCRQNAHTNHRCTGEHARTMRWCHGGFEDAIPVQPKRFEGCFSYVFHDILTENPQLVLLRACAEDRGQRLKYPAVTTN